MTSYRAALFAVGSCAWTSTIEIKPQPARSTALAIRSIMGVTGEIASSNDLPRPQARGRFLVPLENEPVGRILLVREGHELDHLAARIGPGGVRAVAAEPDRVAVEIKLLARVIDGVLPGPFDGEGHRLACLLRVNPEPGEGLLFPLLPVVAPAEEKRVGPVRRGSDDYARSHSELLGLLPFALEACLPRGHLNRRGLVLVAAELRLRAGQAAAIVVARRDGQPGLAALGHALDARTALGLLEHDLTLENKGSPRRSQVARLVHDLAGRVAKQDARE